MSSTLKTVKSQPLTLDMREALKEIISRELQKLPETLESLEPAARINFLCKLIGYALPKVDAVHYNTGEPDIWC